jgi:hypothetical protein
MIAENFYNFGCLFDEVPKDLFEKIKDESTKLEKENKPLKSGLSGSGVAKHFYMNENNRKQFFDYIMYLKDVYLNTFNNYLSIFNMFSHDTPFVCKSPWYNLQRKYEFIPNHKHDGVLSYTTWINIPFDSKDETSEGSRYASCFEFTFMGSTGSALSQIIEVDRSYEGKIMMFPSSITHCVYPFYKSDDVRISLSGNILLDTSKTN